MLIRCLKPEGLRLQFGEIQQKRARWGEWDPFKNSSLEGQFLTAGKAPPLLSAPAICPPPLRSSASTLRFLLMSILAAPGMEGYSILTHRSRTLSQLQKWHNSEKRVVLYSEVQHWMISGMLFSLSLTGFSNGKWLTADGLTEPSSSVLIMSYITNRAPLANTPHLLAL